MKYTFIHTDEHTIILCIKEWYKCIYYNIHNIPSVYTYPVYPPPASAGTGDPCALQTGP